MKKFMGGRVTNISSATTTYIDPNAGFDLDEYRSILYNCYTKNLACIVSDSKVVRSKPGVHYISNTLNLFFSWDYVININRFFYKKYPIKRDFMVGQEGVYVIFLIEFIFRNKKLYSKTGLSLLNTGNSFFGIYDTSTNNLNNCEHMLYFSDAMHKFTLYKVLDKDDAIYGTLMKKFKITGEFIQYNDGVKLTLPKSFKQLNNRLCRIKKNLIQISTNGKVQVSKFYNQGYYNFLKTHNSRCFFILRTKLTISKSVIEKLYEYLIMEYPILQDVNNNVLINPYSIHNSSGNIVLMLLHSTESTKIIININQYFVGYIGVIYESIIDFFKKLSQSTNITVSPKPITFNRDLCFHIISEVGYAYLISRYTYSILRNIQPTESTNYIQANYTFTADEATAFRSYSNGDYANYLKCLVSSTLGTFLNNYYVFIHEGANIDLIPLFEGISISDANKYLNYSKKANYSKYYLLSYLSRMATFINKRSYDLPLLFINISNINTNPHFELLKMYGSTDDGSIPIMVNIVYGDDTLVINLSYKKSYSKMKYFFNELIDNILEP